MQSLRENPFRLLGLLSSNSSKEIDSRSKKLRQYFQIHLSEVTEQALRLIVRIPLIQRREKCPSREGKSTFP